MKFEHFLHAGNRELFLFLGLTLFIWGMAGIYRGLIVSLEHFRDISYADTLEMLVRASCGSFLLLAGFGSAGAFWSVAAGALVLFVLVLRRGERIRDGYTCRLQEGGSKGRGSGSGRSLQRISPVSKYSPPLCPPTLFNIPVSFPHRSPELPAPVPPPRGEERNKRNSLTLCISYNYNVLSYEGGRGTRRSPENREEFPRKERGCPLK